MQHYCKADRSWLTRSFGLRRTSTVLLAILIVALQLWVSAFHQHALQEKADDCVACQLAEQDLPPPTIAPQTDLSAAQYFLVGAVAAATPAYFFLQLISAYLAPYPQAPPVVPSQR